tara:strand:- start:180 stop:410 length:231 start_codon:yes stop_codon:yes gene_type:complete
MSKDERKKTTINDFLNEYVSGKKTTRLFASFANKEHQDNAFTSVLNKLKKDDQFELVLFMGMLDSTIVEGYTDEQE